MVIIFLKTLEKKKGVSDVRSKNIERQLVRKTENKAKSAVSHRDFMINLRSTCTLGYKS